MPDDPAHTWRWAVDAAARGEYAVAGDRLEDLMGAPDPWPSLTLSTLASHRRQIGAVSRAAELDERALEVARDTESRAEALVGTAADAVARGDAHRAIEVHASALDDAAMHWRTLTRWHWVGAESQLLAGDRDAAAEHARAAVAACVGRSARHEAKSAIILAATTGDVGALPAVAGRIAAHGWATLQWPLALVAADQPDRGGFADPGDVSAAWITRAWATGRAATWHIERSLPPDLVDDWRGHPGVLRLRASERPLGDG